ncbi:MAG TPA: hypothetical protein VHQ93_00530 [Chitinophagaceae bacterium]|jgi:hypothetical protein|nr:hypothetical protein [Chitinophagaceae bacterium]
MYDNIYSQSYSDAWDSDEKDEAGKPSSEYSFQGFAIDFNEKVMLTPVDEKKKTKANG